MCVCGWLRVARARAPPPTTHPPGPYLPWWVCGWWRVVCVCGCLRVARARDPPPTTHPPEPYLAWWVCGWWRVVCACGWLRVARARDPPPITHPPGPYLAWWVCGWWRVVCLCGWWWVEKNGWWHVARQQKNILQDMRDRSGRMRKPSHSGESGDSNLGHQAFLCAINKFCCGVACLYTQHQNVRCSLCREHHPSTLRLPGAAAV